MTMVAVGGSIGTGLLLGSAAALEQAGPSVILSYVIAAFIAYTVAMALGELASMHPAAGSFGLYGELYLNQYLGFLCRAGYWAAIAFSIGAELVASATYMSYWLPAVPSEVWVIVFSALLLLVNLGSVGSYGRFEFWFSMIKFATIVAFIVAGAALLVERPRSPAIHRSRRILPQRSNRPSARGVLGHLRLRRNRNARRHHRRIAFPKRSSLAPRASPSSCWPVSTSAPSPFWSASCPGTTPASPKAHSSACSAWPTFQPQPTS